MQNRFESAIGPAQAAQRAFKVPASVTLAQWAQESGYGRHMPEGSNNPFGIKAIGDQPYVEAETTEVIHGIHKHIMARFRKFDSLDAAFAAHAEFLCGPRYARAMEYTSNPNEFALMLHICGYATDPNYGPELIALMREYNLYQYDVA